MGFGASASASQSTTTSSSSGNESSSANSRRLDVAQENELKKLLTKFGLGMGAEDAQYSKGAAIADASGMINELFEQYRNTDLPQILSAQGQSGGFSSSGAQLLVNDAYARTVSKGAGVIAQNIANYEGIQQAQKAGATTSFASILQGLLGAKESSSASSAFSTKSKSKTTAVSAKAGF